MGKKILINASQPEESRIAILENGKLEIFEIQTAGEEQLKGNIYKGKVANVNSSLQAAFVDIGLEKPAFLPLDEVNFRNRPPFQPETPRKSRKPKITDIFEKGQEVIVQVSRDGFGKKPPTLSTFYSIPGRYLVLTPFTVVEGISRRIEVAEQREQLKKIIGQLRLPQGFGVIVRTAGMNQKKRELLRDLKYLLNLWKQIEKECRNATDPSLVFKDRDIVIRTLRDYYSPDIAEVIVDKKEIYNDIHKFFRAVLRRRQRNLKLYTGDIPLFQRYNVEGQIETVFKRRVDLPSGGYLIIDPAEALTAIDVNSGKSDKGKSLEETAQKTNLEAVEEIARQLRLRDIGGLIIIDLIDMKFTRNMRAIERSLREMLRKDKARFDMSRISKFGILELSRERYKPAKVSTRYTTCPTCEGGGLVKTVESASLAVLRRVQSYLTNKSPKEIKIGVPEGVGLYLLNQKRGDLALIEKYSNVKIHIQIREKLKPDEMIFEPDEDR